MSQQKSFPFMNGKKYSATIARGKNRFINIRVFPGDPRVDEGDRLIEVLYGDDEEELRERAEKFAKEQT